MNEEVTALGVPRGVIVDLDPDPICLLWIVDHCTDEEKMIESLSRERRGLTGLDDVQQARINDCSVEIIAFQCHSVSP